MHYESREEMLRKIQEDTHKAVAKILEVRHYEIEENVEFKGFLEEMTEDEIKIAEDTLESDRYDYFTQHEQ